MLEGFSSVTRLEIVDHSPCKACDGVGLIKDVSGVNMCPECNGVGSRGREVIFWDEGKKVEVSLQDDNRTLKVFISERPREKEPVPMILIDETGTDQLSENEG